MAKRRVEEKYQARRDELLDAAWELLVVDGFDAVTVNLFLARSGVSKGAFYHYFESWEELLESVIQRVAGTGVQELAANLGDREAPPLEQLNRFIGIAADRPPAATLLRRLFLQIYRARDANLLWRLIRKTDDLSLPIIERIVEDGVATGEFNTPFTTEVAETILNGWNQTLLKVFDLLESGLSRDQIRRDILRRVEATAHITELLLGLARGAVHRPDAGDIDRIIDLTRAR